MKLSNRGMIQGVFLCALLVAHIAVADENWDRVCDELESTYKSGLSAVVEKGKSYDLTTYGDGERTFDVWRHTLTSYRVIAERIVKERGKEGKNCRRKVELWFAEALERLEADFRRENAQGSYVGIFHLGNKTDLYARATQVLLLKTEPAARWARISSAT